MLVARTMPNAVGMPTLSLALYGERARLRPRCHERRIRAIHSIPSLATLPNKERTLAVPAAYLQLLVCAACVARRAIVAATRVAPLRFDGATHPAVRRVVAVVPAVPPRVTGRRGRLSTLS